MINLKYVKPGLCPYCGVALPKSPNMILINLNDGAVMPQPACESDLDYLKTKEGQNEILLACKAIWLLEINEGTQRTEQERIKEIKRISKLKVI